MSVAISMLGSVWQRITDFFTGIFALVPQFLYFIYACCSSLMDVMQFVIRKIVGLDTYYIGGEAVSGDIVSDFINGILGITGDARYSALTTVFWSLVIFGCILLVLTTIFAIIKSHYNYDAQKSNPVTIVISSVKTFFLMAIIPICCVFGIYLSNILLQAIDQATSYSSSTQISEVYKNSSVNYTEVFKKGQTKNGDDAYATYNLFNFYSYTNAPTFTGVLFKISCKDANRVRSESYTASRSSTQGSKDFKWSDFGIFTSEIEAEADRIEDVANQIDFAFANGLTLKEKRTASILGTESLSLVSSFSYMESAVWYLGLINFDCFSKFNVGLVWYYYNLWNFNFFLAYAGIIVCVGVFGSIFFGLVSRLVTMLCLFMLYPTFVGIGPLDNNQSIGKWKTDFIKNTLMGYGAVVGLNLSYFLLDEFQKIYFFRYELLNNLMSLFIVIIILVVIKDIIKITSAVAGGEDAFGTGEAVKKEAKQTAKKGAEKTMKTANFALKVGAKFDPTLRAIYEAKKKVDQAIKKLKERKASLGLGEAGDFLKNLREQAKREKEDADESESKAEKERKQSQADTDEFEKMIDEVETMSDDDAYNEARNFGIRTGNAGSDEEKSAENIYKRYRNDQREEFNKIDADMTLSDEEKAERKRDVHEKLRNEAISDFRTNNQHAIKEGQLLDESAKLRESSEMKQAQYDKSMKKQKKGGVGGMLFDLSGSTIKLVGSLTGVTGAWKSIDSNSEIGDEFRTFGQTLLAQEGKDINSKLLTKKQKEDQAKEKTKEKRKAIFERMNKSEIEYKKIQDLCAEIIRWRTRVNNVNETNSEMRNKRLSTKTKDTVATMKVNVVTEIDAKAQELKDRGRIAEAKALEKKKAEEQKVITDLQKFCRKVALEEKAKGGTVAEMRSRATARIDAECSRLHKEGLLQAERILKMRKGSAISSIK